MSDLQVRGPLAGGSGSPSPFTASLSGSQRVNDAHGRFFDAAYYNRLYSGGAGLTTINNATFTIATLGATATPIIGLWNPLSSQIYASILQVTLATIMTALQATGPGGYQWAVSTGNNGLTLGSLGFNRRTLLQSGGVCKSFAGVALTGLTNNLVAMQGSALGGGSSYNQALLGTAAGFQTQQVSSVENFEGGFLVPPGGVIALLATTTPVAHSVVPSILWEELLSLP